MSVMTQYRLRSPASVTSSLSFVTPTGLLRSSWPWCARESIRELQVLSLIFPARHRLGRNARPPRMPIPEQSRQRCLHRASLTSRWMFAQVGCLCVQQFGGTLLQPSPSYEGSSGTRKLVVGVPPLSLSGFKVECAGCTDCWQPSDFALSP